MKEKEIDKTVVWKVSSWLVVGLSFLFIFFFLFPRLQRAGKREEVLSLGMGSKLRVLSEKLEEIEGYEADIPSEAVFEKEEEKPGLVRVEIINANGVPGAAGVLEEKLRALGGFRVDSLKTALVVEEKTELGFRSGFEEEAERVGEVLARDYPFFEKKVFLENEGYDMIIVLGQ